MEIHLNKKRTLISIYLTWMFLLWHILQGVAILIFQFPIANQQYKKRKIRDWSIRLLNLFDVNLQVEGMRDLPVTPFLLVSNHISWLDIHLINAHRPISFVAKSEVAGWPVFGWMARQLQTIFIRRGDVKHARLVVDQMTQALSSTAICIFPEGTSTLGTQVLPFKPNLFESAIQAQVPTYPLAIEYFCRVTSTKSTTAAFVGDMGLMTSMMNIIKSRGLVAKLTFMSPIESYDSPSIDRKQLSQQCYENISVKLTQNSDA